jgi:hypothetical protein
LTDPRSLVWAAQWLCNTDVSTCPLLKQGRQKSTCKADVQAREPEFVHPDCISGRRERWLNRRGRDGCTSYIRVGEEPKYVLEIEFGVVLWVCPEVLDRHRNHRGERQRINRSIVFS